MDPLLLNDRPIFIFSGLGGYGLSFSRLVWLGIENTKPTKPAWGSCKKLKQEIYGQAHVVPL